MYQTRAQVQSLIAASTLSAIEIAVAAAEALSARLDGVVQLDVDNLDLCLYG
jgi:hypothetical protein